METSHLLYAIVEDAEGTFCVEESSCLALVSHRDLVAIVRRVEIDGARQLDKQQIQEWITDHQRTSVDIFQYRPILPLRFGAVMGTEEIEDFLAACYLHIKTALERVRGRAEFVVHLFWDLGAVLEEIHGRDYASRANGSLIESGRLLFEAAQAIRERIVQDVHEKLSAVSLRSSEAKLTDESMLLNRSYLIDRTREDAFDNAMAKLGEENPSYLRFKYVGPLPPYSFVPLEFKRGSFELVDRSRKALSLPERARFGDVKAAYRAMSMHHHPDRNLGDQTAESRFREATEAYEVLETYCRSCRMNAHPRDEEEFHFTKDEIDRALVVV